MYIAYSSLKAIENAAYGQDRMIAASLDELYGRRHLTIASVIHRSQLWAWKRLRVRGRRRQMFKLTLSSRRYDDGIVRWLDTHSGTEECVGHSLLVEKDIFLAALSKFIGITDICEVVAVTYPQYTASGDIGADALNRLPSK